MSNETKSETNYSMNNKFKQQHEQHAHHLSMNAERALLYTCSSCLTPHWLKIWVLSSHLHSRPWAHLLLFYFHLSFPIFFFSFHLLHCELYSELDNLIAKESLCYSANKRSDDAYNVSTSLTEPFLRPRGSGKLCVPILRMEELCQKQSPNDDENGTSFRSRWTTIWRITSLGRHKAGTAESVRKTWSTIFLRWTMASTCSWRKQQDKIRVLRWFQKFFGLLSSNWRTLWRKTKWPRVDGVHSNSFQLERAYLSQGLFFQHPISPWKRTDSRWKGKRQRTTDYLLHSTQPFSWRLRRTWWWWNNSSQKCINTVIGNVIRMPLIGYNNPEHKIKECNSGKQSHMRSSYTTLCKHSASTE